MTPDLDPFTPSLDRPAARRRRAARRPLAPLASLALALAALAATPLACGGASDGDAGGPAPGAPAAAEAPEELSAEGFAVWESNRTGDWRIWYRRLDGSAPRQLSPDEPALQHCCPHISPDGRRVVYLARAAGRDEYPEREVAGPLRLIDLGGDGGEGDERVLVEAARTYGWGDRAAVWRDDSSLIYVGADGRTFQLDLAGGGSTALTDQPREELGWLLDPTLTHASNAAPSFSLYDRASRQVVLRPPLGGCEPYFSHDGRWGYWVARGGGPVRRMRLADRRASTLLAKGDPRLPAGYGYVYFPMLSRDGRAFAFGASGGDHDHFNTDYEVFVAPADPYRLELTGVPRRLSDHPATDRYPDVWVPPLPLGVRGGEAPLAVEIEPPGPRRDWRWTWGDGETATGAAGRHLYRRPGTYAVRAEAGGAVLTGRVVVEPPRPPEAVEAVLDPGGRRVAVRFDRPVVADDARLALASGTAVAGRELAADRRTLELTFAEPVRAGDRLRLAGIAGADGAKAEMPASWVRIEPPPWPSDRGGLVFAWQTADQPNLVYDPEVGLERTYPLTALGRVRFNRLQQMVLGDGSYRAPDAAAAALAAAVRATSELTVEATLTPLERQPPAPPRTVIALGDGRRGGLRLDQRGERLVLRLAGGEGEPAEVELFAVAFDRSVHLVAAYGGGRLAVYRDGERVLERRVGGSLAGWSDGPLVFGDRPGGGADWNGRLEGVALYGRALGAAEAAENHARYARFRETHGRRVEPLAIRGRLAAKSAVPALREISPYRTALAVYEYQVESVVEGKLEAPRVRVARWVILDGEALPAGAEAVGESARLVLEPFAANPQLESHYLADTLPPAPGSTLFYDAGGG